MPKPTVVSRTSEHLIWRTLRQRCLNPKCKDWANYGGRGITICPQWQSFTTFLRDVGPKPEGLYSLDRCDNNGNYEPGNVRWATRREQANNRRDTVHLTFKGQTKTRAEWARHLGVPYGTIERRAKDGHPLDEDRTCFRGRRLA